MRHLTLTAITTALMIATTATNSLPQQSTPTTTAAATSSPRPKTSPPAQPPVASAGTPLFGSPITIEQALYLIRSTLMTLNDADQSGNYSVLRDLAAPDFQARNTAADLSANFADLRRRNFDLFAAAVAAPQFTTMPAIDNAGRLRLTGFFSTRPQQINFDLMFQQLNGRWRLYGIAVATPQAPDVPAPTQKTDKLATSLAQRWAP